MIVNLWGAPRSCNKTFACSVQKQNISCYPFFTLSNQVTLPEKISSCQYKYQHELFKNGKSIKLLSRLVKKRKRIQYSP